MIGPTSFVINVNDLLDVENVKPICLLMIPPHSSLETQAMIWSIQSHINELEKYSKLNSLTIHPEKSQILIISKKAFIGPLPEVKIHDQTIGLVSKSKCLGVTILIAKCHGAHM